jgi:hypothetical protein
LKHNQTNTEPTSLLAAFEKRHMGFFEQRNAKFGLGDFGKACAAAASKAQAHPVRPGFAKPTAG